MDCTFSGGGRLGICSSCTVRREHLYTCSFISVSWQWCAEHPSRVLFYVLQSVCLTRCACVCGSLKVSRAANHLARTALQCSVDTRTIGSILGGMLFTLPNYISLASRPGVASLLDNRRACSPLGHGKPCGMCTTQYFRENRSSLQQLNIVRLALICDGQAHIPTKSALFGSKAFLRLYPVTSCDSP